MRQLIVRVEIILKIGIWKIIRVIFKHIGHYGIGIQPRLIALLRVCRLETVLFHIVFNNRNKVEEGELKDLDDSDIIVFAPGDITILQTSDESRCPRAAPPG